jgi:hypothetical protein
VDAGEGAGHAQRIGQIRKGQPPEKVRGVLAGTNTCRRRQQDQADEALQDDLYRQAEAWNFHVPLFLL